MSEEFEGLQEPADTGIQETTEDTNNEPAPEGEQGNNDLEETGTDGGYEEADATDHDATEVVKPKTVTQYSTDELTTIIQNDGEVDVSRLSQEGVALMKAMQRGFTPKLEEAASIRKELKELKDSFEAAKPPKQPETLEEAYDANPQEVTQYIDGELAKLINEDAAKNAVDIEQLRNLKQTLAFREINTLRDQRQSQARSQQVMQKMISAVPDLETKQGALAKFAIEVLNYTSEELASATNPSVSGEAAVRTVSRINAAYEKFNASNSVHSKQKQKQPTKVEAPGGEFTTKTPERHTELKSKAIRGETPWSNYFMSLEE